MKSEAYGQVARMGQALASGSRLELLELIAQAEQPVETLSRVTGYALTTVSSHLQVLKAAGLVLTRREGTTIYYRLRDDEVARLLVTLTAVASRSVPELQLGGADGGAVRVASSSVSETDAYVLDVRPTREYDAAHYPGAVSIPLGELSARVAEVPSSRRVVVYCRGEFCLLARDAARLLRGRGVDAYAMDSGVLEWRAGNDVALVASD